MLENENEVFMDGEESAEAILENVFGESLEISPHLTLPEKSDKEQAQTEQAQTEQTQTDPTKSEQTPPQPTEPKKTKPVVQEVKPFKSKNKKAKPTTEEATISFSDLPLSKEVQQAITAVGYEKPTPIQAEIIPHLLYGKDVLAQSQTGTGKTAAFALPILSRIETDCKEPQVLVLVPTRELAIQVAKSFESYGANLKGFQHAVIYGGQDYEIQFRQLRKGPQVIVGTPGRTIDHIKSGKLDISEIECLVLDEADEMLNMGFLDDVQFVLDRAPAERQIALFSATLPDQIRKISQRYLTDPAKVTIKRKTLTADSIRQRAVLVSPRDRVDTLIRFLEAEDADGAIVFTRTRETTSVVADKLTRAGLRAFALNGEMQQKARERTIEKLKSGQLDILVATDIAARGLDVSRISHVFNYDPPEGPEAYTHRIGRTGRAGKKGEAIIFLTHSQRGKLKFIEKITRQEIEIVDPPTADQINAQRIKRFHANIEKTITNRDMTFFQKLVDDFIAQSDHSVEQIAAAIAMMGQNGRDFLMKDRPVRERRERGNGRNSDGNPRGRFSGPPEPGMARFRIAIGKRDGVRPGNIVGAVAGESDIEGDEIGSIRIHQSYSTIDLPADRADEILDRLSDTRVSGRPMRLRPYEEQNERGPRSSRASGKRKSYGKSNRSRSATPGKSGPPSSRFKKNKKSKARSKSG